MVSDHWNRVKVPFGREPQLPVFKSNGTRRPRPTYKRIRQRHLALAFAAGFTTAVALFNLF